MNHKSNLLALAISAALLGGLPPITPLPSAQAQPAPKPEGALDDHLAKVASYKLGGDRKPLNDTTQHVIASQSDAARRAETAKKLASLLTNPAATFEAKDFACRQLYVIATDAEVPQVATLLSDEKLGHMARYVLEAMATPPADAAMRDALPKAQGREKIGLIGSIGNRRDAKAVSALRELLTAGDAQVSSAAAAALGKIANDQAVEALRAARKAGGAEELQKSLADALLVAADHLAAAGKSDQAVSIYQELMQLKTEPIVIGALRGLAALLGDKAQPTVITWLKGNEPAKQLAAGGILRHITGADATRALLAEFDSLPTVSQVLAIEALAGRNETSARQRIETIARGGADESVQLSALRALGSLGDASSIPLLADTAAKGKTEAKEAARQSLSRIKGQGVDAAIADAATKGEPTVRAELIRALASRGASATVPQLLKIASDDAEESVRSAATTALGSLVTAKDFPALVDRVSAAKSEGERNTARDAVGAAASRMPDRDQAAVVVSTAIDNADVAKADAKTKAALLDALTQIGGDKALAAVRTAQKSADPAVQDAATRAITSWRDAAAVEDMLAIVKSGTDRNKILAMRGLNRVLSQPNAGLTSTQKTDTFKQMLAASTRPEEKTLVVGGLGDLRDPAAFAMLTPLLEDEPLRTSAANAIIKVAGQGGREIRSAARPALEKVIASGVSDDLKKKAQEILDRRQ